MSYTPKTTLMIRKHPPSDLEGRENEHVLWPYLIEIEGTPGRMDWGQLVAKVWEDQSRGKTAEEVARRLIDCWNACDGLNPAAIPKLQEACKAVLASLVDAGRDHAPSASLAREAIALSEQTESSPAKCKCGQPGRAAHPCPYASDIRNDNTTLCNCCDNCTHECAMDV